MFEGLSTRLRYLAGEWRGIILFTRQIGRGGSQRWTRIIDVLSHSCDPLMFGGCGRWLESLILQRRSGERGDEKTGEANLDGP